MNRQQVEKEILSINGIQMVNMFVSAANLLCENKAMVDAMNVFPVPDGDTGTNMSMTLSYTAAEMLLVKESGLSGVAEVIASASLRGARGNSGVILSQLFRGFAKGLTGLEVADAVQLALALEQGAETAYKAVKTPKEGTMLTVAKAFAKAAMQKAKIEPNIVTVFETALSHAKEVLGRTPDMLPALKQAGVVDAGGQGFLFIAEGALDALRTGEDYSLVDKKDVNETVRRAVGERKSLPYPYCTELIILKHESGRSEMPLRVFLDNVGDSTVVVDDTDIIKVHVHTNNPGQVLTEALKYGRLTDIKIDNMEEQLVIEEEKKPPKRYGFVAVAVGEGFVHLFCEQLSVDVMVEGGQTMNPSTEELISAIMRVEADCVFVLPNNKNIVPAALQAVEQVEKKVVVLPTVSVLQGISALIAFDEEGTVDENVEVMTQAISHVRSGAVTCAVRETVVDGMSIRVGDYLSLVEGKIEGIANSATEALHQLVEKMLHGDAAVMTVFYGADVSEEQASEAVEKLVEAYPEIDILLQQGGQPIYPYLVSIE